MNGVHIRLLIGEALGLKSPVRTFAQTLYAEYHLLAGQSAAVPEDVEELAVYAVDAKLKVDDEILPPRHLALLTAGIQNRQAPQELKLPTTGTRGSVAAGAGYLTYNFCWFR
jgi:redox-sensitive bicupin YhaK (pirin superfamily)